MTKILIVEDNALFRETLKDSIIAEFPEIQVELAANGKEALIKVDWFRPQSHFYGPPLAGRNGE